MNSYQTGKHFPEINTDQTTRINNMLIYDISYEVYRMCVCVRKASAAFSLLQSDTGLPIHPWTEEISFPGDDQSLQFDGILNFTAQWIIH